MKFRQVPTTLIAASLLSVACAASACEMSCELKIAGPGCHNTTTKAAQAQGQMGGMQHCGMKTSAKSSSFQRADAGTCSHSVCKQQPQLMETELQSAALQTLAFQHILIVSVLAYPPSPEIAWARLFESPPSRTPLLASLQTILRV